MVQVDGSRVKRTWATLLGRGQELVSGQCDVGCLCRLSDWMQNLAMQSFWELPSSSREPFAG